MRRRPARSVPFAGMTRIRFDGSALNLSAPAGPPTEGPQLTTARGPCQLAAAQGQAISTTPIHASSRMMTAIAMASPLGA